MKREWHFSSLNPLWLLGWQFDRLVGSISFVGEAFLTAVSTSTSVTELPFKSKHVSLTRGRHSRSVYSLSGSVSIGSPVE